MALLDAWKHRNFRLFYVGQAASLLGDFAFFVALAWHVLALGGGAEALGLVLTAYMGAQVAFLLVGGVVVDRFPRRAVIVTMDLVQLALCAAMALLAWQGALGTALLVVLAVLFGAATAISMPALTAFVPETVPSAQLPSANSLYQGTRTVAMLAGPALGGFLVAAGGPAWAFAFDAASFAASGVLLALARGLPRTPSAGGSPLREAWEGARYVASIPWVWIAIVLFAVMNVAEAGPRNVGMPLLVADELHLGPEALGFVSSAMALGALGATLALGALAIDKGRGIVAYAGVVLGGIAFVLTALAPSYAWVLAASVLRGVSFATFGFLWEVSLQQRVEPSMRGRVASLDMLGSFALIPLSTAATGALAQAYGARWPFLAGGVIILAGGLVGLLLPRARRFESAA